MSKTRPSDPAFLSEGRADQYFLNTREVLRGEGVDLHVTMEVFSNGAGILCGIGEVVGHLASSPGSDRFAVHAAIDGTRISPKEVVLRIEGAYSSFGIYETSLLGTLGHGTGWATGASACVEAAGPIPVISFGARHVHPAVSDRMEYAAVVGGCVGCATPDGAALAGQSASGTMPHAMILLFGDTVTASEAFDRHMPEATKRIVLVDTFRDEVEESVRVADKMGDRLWGVRLDTSSELGGVTVDLVNRTRAKLDAEGHVDVKILVSGGFGAEKIRSFVDAECPVDGFGVGSAISGARPIDFTADLKEIDGRAVSKRGRKPGRSDSGDRLSLAHPSIGPVG